MKNFIHFLFIFWCLISTAQEVTEKTKQLSKEACECIDKIDINAEKEQKSKEISECISSAITADQIQSQLEGVLEKTKDTLSKIENFSKIDSLSIEGKDLNIVISDEGYEEIESYLYDNCPKMKHIYFTDNKEYENSYSNRKKAKKFYEEGQVAFQKQEYTRAVVLFNKAVNKDKNFAFAWDNLGYSYRKLDNYKKAIECYKKSLELDPKGKMPLMNIAVAYQLNNDLEGAKNAYKNYKNIYPDDVEAFYGLGRIYSFQKNYEPALENLFQAYLMYTEMKSPYNIDAQKNIAIIYQELEKENNLDLFFKVAKKYNIQIEEE